MEGFLHEIRGTLEVIPDAALAKVFPHMRDTFTGGGVGDAGLHDEHR